MSEQGPRLVRRPASMTPEQRQTKNLNDLDRVRRFISDLQSKRFFGKITISLQDGSIAMLHSEQVLKLDDIG